MMKSLVLNFVEIELITGPLNLHSNNNHFCEPFVPLFQNGIVVALNGRPNILSSCSLLGTLWSKSRKTGLGKVAAAVVLPVKGSPTRRIIPRDPPSDCMEPGMFIILNPHSHLQALASIVHYVIHNEIVYFH